MHRDHAFVVVGCGSVGSAALYWLSRMAAPYASVLALERGPAGQTRTGRTGAVGYARGSDAHAALGHAAREAWRQVECLSGQRLVTRTGGLVIEDGGHRPGTVDRHLAVAARHGESAEELDAADLAGRWPQLHPHGTERAVYRPDVGIVDLPRADATHVALAGGYGAEIRDRTPVRALHPTGRHVEVVTDDEVHRAEHVVVAAGAGTDGLLDGLAGPAGPVPRTVLREQVTGYATPHLIDFSPGRFPVVTWRGQEGTFRGLPVHGDVATTLVRPGEPAGRAERERFLAAHLPGFAGPELYTTTRVATVPADRRPVLDTLADGRVSVASGTDRSPGLVSLAGRILAELACTGTTRHPIGDFALDRPGLARSPVGGITGTASVTALDVTGN